MAISIASNEPVWFGRANMTKITQSIHSYQSNYNDYTVNNRIDDGIYSYGNYVIPFEITIGSTVVVAILSGNLLKFRVKGKNFSNPRFSVLTTGTNTSRITGYSIKSDVYESYIQLPHSFYSTSDDRDLYYYESSDLVVFRVEEYDGDIAELWITNNGYIQYLYYDKYGTSNKIKTYINSHFSEGESIKCTDGECPYQVAESSSCVITLSGTLTSDRTYTLYCSGYMNDVTLNFHTGDTASTILDSVKSALNVSAITSRFNLSISTTNDITTLSITAISSGYQPPPYISFENRYGLSNYTREVAYGADLCTCNYYSTSRASCYYGGKKREWVDDELKQEYAFNSINGKVLLSFSDEVTFSSSTQTSIESPLTSKCGGAITDYRVNKTNKQLLLYKQPLTSTELGTTPTKLSIRVNGETLYAHFLPTNVGGNAIEALSSIRMMYNNSVLQGINKVDRVSSVQPVPIIVDKMYNRCYDGVSSTYYWEYVNVYGFYEPLQNVSKVRFVFYSDGDTTSGTPLPNTSYPNLYFLYRTTFDNTGSNSNWSGVQAVSVPTPVAQTPHLMEITFSTPITIAQWCIVPRALGSGYIRSAGDISDVVFVTNDDLSLNYYF